MRVAYFDAFAGAAGDMILAALLDAGRATAGLEARVRAQLETLGLPGWRLSLGREERGHLWGLRARVEVEGHPPGRTFYDIKFMLEAATLEPEVKRLSLAAFGLLAEAEAKIHGIDHDLVHFHEVGAIDSIVDIVGAAACLVGLGVEEAWCSPLPVGGGLVECAHGTLPVPAPATLEILRGVPVVAGPASGELTTPTGAALLATFCGPRFGAFPAMRPQTVGYGVGSRDLGGLPNLLRVVVGEAGLAAAQLGREEVSLLETNLDDLNPQLYGELTAQLFAAGAVDVWLTPVQMKKGRPGTLLSVLCRPQNDEACLKVLFRESTTLGVRMSRPQRLACARELRHAETPLGRLTLKVAIDPWGGVRVQPEYESLRRLAAEAGVSLLEAEGVAREAASRLAAQIRQERR